MDNEIMTWLNDVLQSIEEIESYFSDSPKIFENYIKDIKTKRAVEHSAQQVGICNCLLAQRDSNVIELYYVAAGHAGRGTAGALPLVSWFLHSPVSASCSSINL